MSKLNITSMMHPTFIKKVLKATRKALNCNVSHIENRKGGVVLAVRYRINKYGRKGFIITDKLGFNVAEILMGAVKRMNELLFHTSTKSLSGVRSFFIKNVLVASELMWPYLRNIDIKGLDERQHLNNKVPTMNNNQIKWASQHDWFIKANGIGVLVKDFVLIKGVYQESLVQINDFQELRKWAGY